jgi:hypothetical protein
MGLKNGTAMKTWLSIREGKIALKNGETFTLFDSIEGYLKGLSTRDGKFGVELHVLLQDGDTLYDLNIPVKDHPSPGKNTSHTSYFRAFAHLAPNIDVTKPVEIIPSLKIVNEKKQSTLFVSQNDAPLKWAYKAGDGVMPRAEEIKNSKGEVLALDWSEVEKFRMDKVDELNQRIMASAGETSANQHLGAPTNNDSSWQKAYEAPTNTFGDEPSQDNPAVKKDDGLPF